MTAGHFTSRLQKFGVLSAGIVVAAIVSGATPYEFSVISKDDRAVDLSACAEGPANAEEDLCSVDLPNAQAQSIVVAPGLTVVSADPS